ncbi:hypothetical protein BGZ98_003452 [Dissophora globulifera]|nr:hypothetical protein BGZ98_003452 [Dissophora globulifera]
MSYYASAGPGNNHGNPSPNSFVATNSNYIASPFDDHTASPPRSNNYEKNSPYDNPYNPDYMPSSYHSGSSPANSYTQHSTQEHALSPRFAEKGLAGGAAAGAGAEMGGQTYAMQHLGQNNTYDAYGHQNHDAHYQNDNNQYYNGYDDDRPSLSNDTTPMRPPGETETSDGLIRSKSGITRVKYGKEKSKHLRCFPCIRSTCGRVTCCVCLVLLLIIIVLAIVIVTVFKLPKIDYLGMQSEPQFLFNQGNTTMSVNLVANIQVVNPNPLGFHFESIVATAYYPNYSPSIGGGNLTDVDFPSKSNKTIAFPISASYVGSQDSGFTVIKDVLSRCGFTGAAVTGLTINYDLKLTIKIIGIPISPTVKNQHVNFACPSNIADIANGVPDGLTSMLGGGTKSG